MNRPVGFTVGVGMPASLLLHNSNGVHYCTCGSATFERVDEASYKCRACGAVWREKPDEPSQEPPAHLVEAAVKAARSSWCAKDSRGSVVFDPAHKNRYVAAANGPAPPFKCSGSEECRAGCGKLAVHAEERALFEWESRGGAPGPDVLHIRVVDNEPVVSGPPSCITCSRTMLLHNVAAVWLWHEAGWRRYPIVEFHALSLQHEKHRLPVIR